MTPTYINIELTEKEQSTIMSIVNKSFSDADMFSFETWPTYNIVHFETNLGWHSIMLDKKNKVLKVSAPRTSFGKIKCRLDIYADKKFIISHTFTNLTEARKYAEHHLNSQKLDGYSTSFTEKLKYSTTNIVTI